MNLYNDICPETCAWVKQLIADGLIPEGEVLCRDISELTTSDISKYKQCHFFSGIAGWPYALHLAKWPIELKVWTASCPCQPFSNAGKQMGEKDERHLWPELRRLIATCLPDTIFGEQVASRSALMWMSNVRFDLEQIHYWTAFYEDLHEMQKSEKEKSIQEILRCIIRRVEAALYQMPEGIRVSLEKEKQAKAKSHEGESSRERQGLQVESERNPHSKLSGFKVEVQSPESGTQVQPRQAHPKTSEEDGSENLRSIGYSSGNKQDGDRPSIQQPIDRPNKLKQGLHIQQHQDSLLCHQRIDGELGGGEGAICCEGVDEKEIKVNEEREITDAFRALVEESVQRNQFSRVLPKVEAVGYAVGVFDLCAAGVSAPHKRQRLFWVATKLGDAGSVRRDARLGGDGGGQEESRGELRPIIDRHGGDRKLADGSKSGLQGHAGHGDGGDQPRRECASSTGSAAESGGWDDYELINFKDGSVRRIEPGTFPMAARLPKGVVHSSDPSEPIDPSATQEARTTRIKGYGNSIVPELAAQFVRSFMEVKDLCQ